MATYPVKNCQMHPHAMCIISKIDSLWDINKDHHMKGLNVKSATALLKETLRKQHTFDNVIGKKICLS